MALSVCLPAICLGNASHLDWERQGDSLLGAGRYREAGQAYAKSAEFKFYEDLRGGFGILSVKDMQPADAELEIHARLMKGYILLARDRTGEGIECLSKLAGQIEQMQDSAFRERARLDAHFLLALGHLDLKDWTNAASYARSIMRSKAPVERERITEFCRMAATAASGPADNSAKEGPDQEIYGRLFHNAAAHFAEKRFESAREYFGRILKSQPAPDWEVVLRAANGAVRSFVQESSFIVDNNLLNSISEWASQNLPQKYSEYGSVLVARACFLAQQKDTSRQALDAMPACMSRNILAEKRLLQGRIELCEGDLQEARRSFMQSLACLSPSDSTGPAVMLHLGHIQMLEGDDVGARLTFQRLIDRYPAFELRPAVEAALKGDVNDSNPDSGFNVILISLDSIRADHLGCYGYHRNTSPVLDRLAVGGVLFEDVTAASSWTVPSHMSIFTSLYPGRHGVEKTNHSLNTETETLAENLRNEGFTTAAFVSGPALSGEFGFRHGFDFYDDFTLMSMLESEAKWLRGVLSINEFSTSSIMTTLATAWIEAHRSERFFLFLHLWDVHYDYTPPSPFDVFGEKYAGSEDGRDIVNRDAEIVKRGRTAGLDRLISLYDGEISNTDASLDMLLKSLEESGISGKTLVVVVADHGEAFLEHGMIRHGKSLHEEEIHVPWIMRLPGVIPEGLRLAGSASHVDIMPTVLGLAGIPVPEGVDGINLAEAAKGKAGMPERAVYSRLNNNVWSRAIRWGRYKLVENQDRTVSPLLVVDAGRERSAIDSGIEPATVAEIEADLASALRKESAVRGLASGEGQESADERRELLRSLGYMD